MEETTVITEVNIPFELEVPWNAQAGLTPASNTGGKETIELGPFSQHQMSLSSKDILCRRQHSEITIIVYFAVTCCVQVWFIY